MNRRKWRVDSLNSYSKLRNDFVLKLASEFSDGLKGLVIDLVTSENRTYQISGDRRFQGMYERLFHADSHPTRRNVSNNEMQSALDQATEIRLWTGSTEFRVINEAELEAELAPFPVR